MIGTTLSRYSIEARIGKGGMGEVYQAHDSRLGRSVAIKILPDSTGDEHLRRFMTEAKAASALNHPNIVTVHDVDHDGAVHFIVMEKIEGKPLSAITGSPMPLGRFLDVAIQTSGALAAAHAAGIVHRDIKPANVMITDSGVVKVVDFGLARLLPPPEQLEADSPTIAWESQHTAAGTVLGTIGYMAPEQVQGQRASERSDVFSLGVLFHELLSGRSPFQGDTPLALVAAILRDSPPPLDDSRKDVPSRLARLITRCLQKVPSERPASAGEVYQELLTIRDSLSDAATHRAPRWPLAAGAILSLIALATIALWWRHDSRQQWVRNAAIPEVEQLIESNDVVGALVLARKIHGIAPDDPQVQQMWANITWPLHINSDPPGAEVSIRNYASTGEWLPVGKTPLKAVHLPIALFRYRVSLDGHVTTETAPEFESDVGFFRLHRPEQIPPGMVHVEEGPVRFHGTTAAVPSFWIDRFELSNSEYKRFIDAGGYTNAAYWNEAFVEGGTIVPRETAISRFIDSTGRPGPSGWELGSYPDGEDHHPVEGISWFEAMAYAEFAGKSLPTVFHWTRAAGGEAIFSDMIGHSNFAGKGTVPVGSLGSLGRWGTFDMAGNVKEWCLNASGEQRYTLGGSWSDASYQFIDIDAQSPFERGAGYGVRLVRNITPAPAGLTAAIEASGVRRIDPVDDATFAVFRRLYEYGQLPLGSEIEEVDDSHSVWRKEKVSFEAAYGRERVVAYLFLPKNARPPYQTIVFFPGSDATIVRSSRSLWLRMVEFHIRAGRAVVYPVYQGTYERQISGPPRANALRDRVVQRTMDTSRTVDYLLSRSDIDHERLAFYGVSLGANMAPYILATESRFRGAILFGGGLGQREVPPEVEPRHFLPRVTLPLLFVGGRHDFPFPLESSQRPYFELLGTHAERKRHYVFEGGHVPVQFNDVIREMLAWSDEVLGPVQMR
jgi:eukaryotic-like serine/threonine-protein kinase